MMKNQLFGTIAMGSLFLTPDLALAQDNMSRSDEFAGYTTIGIAAVPDYEGADDHRVLPLVDGTVFFGERYIALQGATLRANVISAHGFEFGPIASLTFGRDDKIKDRAVAALGKIEDAYEIGAFGAVSFDVGGNDELRIALQAVHDVSDVHDAFVISANVTYTVPVDERLTLMLDLGSSYADNDYAQTYFSVTPAQSVASGLQSYAATGGIKDVGAQLTASYRIGDNWGVAANAGYRRLLGDFADSPVVTKGGSANQLSGGIGIFYTF